MKPDFLIVFVAALIPLVLGFLWYNPKTFGNAWMKAAGVTPESAKGANMPLMLGLTYLFSVFIAFTMNFVTIHQWGLMSLLADNPDVGVPGTAAANELKGLLDLYGGKFRTFGHGALHGTITGIFFALPIITINALFERKGFKYIAINAGYWIVAMLLMGGVVCRYSHIY
ncbi:MAG: DUF1761 domain-containing protein [Bacteroidota bacterium]